MSDGKPVAVIGAGIAGLTAASYLRRNGVPVVLFEAGAQIAGMAASYKSPDGFSYDFGAHFITNRLAAAIGVGAQCRVVRHYGEAVLMKGRSYGYPFGLLKVPRFVSSAVATRLTRGRSDAASSSAREWFQSMYGAALADEVALPLLEAWSGVPAHQLSAAVGEKLNHRIFYTVFLKAMSHWSGLAVSNGYCQEMRENPSVWHVYPEGGVAFLCERLAADLTDVIERESPVETIHVDSGKVLALRVKGRDRVVSAVVSTAPCPLLARMVSGSDALAPMRRFRYRPAVVVNLRFDCRGMLPDTVLWTPEPSFPFFRLTETPLSMPWLAPPGKTLITADLGCEVGDAVWNMDEEALGETCLASITAIYPEARRFYLGCRVLKTPIAYPVYLRDYEPDRQRFESGTGIDGLYSIGRNGAFAHILMEDIYWRTLKTCREIVSRQSEP